MHRLEELIALPGISGHEDAVIAYIRQQFARQADDVSVDWLCNGIARIGPEQALYTQTSTAVHALARLGSE
ncbi:MAG: hypothetical protein NT075_23205 [Chloroflexi bacterium]|nr:hypothetical protein [Chloroflexota bacterium]